VGAGGAGEGAIRLQRRDAALDALPVGTAADQPLGLRGGAAGLRPQVMPAGRPGGRDSDGRQKETGAEREEEPAFYALLVGSEARRP
jgi:hypothetical protein